MKPALKPAQNFSFPLTQSFLTAAFVGLLASMALPAGKLWLQGNGLVMLFALAPLFLSIEKFFDSFPIRKALFHALVCCYLSAWAVEIGFFHWGVAGIQTFLGLSAVWSTVMALAVLAMHALASMPALTFYVAIRAYFGPHSVAAFGALLVMPMFEHLAPRMFYFTYGSFLSLSELSAPLLSLGGSALPSFLVFLGGWSAGLLVFRLCKFQLSVPWLHMQKYSTVLAMTIVLVASASLSAWSLFSTANTENMLWTRSAPAQTLLGTKDTGHSSSLRPPLKLLIVQPARRFSQEIENRTTTDAHAIYLEEEKQELERLRDLASRVEDTLAQAPKQPDLVVFPESLFSPIYQTSDTLRIELSRFLDRMAVPTLLHYAIVAPKSGTKTAQEEVNTVFEKIRPEISLAEIRPTSATNSMFPYQKQQLMPYGEYLPWRPVWEKLLPRKTLERMPRLDAVPQLGSASPLALVRTHQGTRTPLDQVMLGVSICFDGISPDFARSAVLAGADVLINLSNLEWMGSRASELVYGAIVRLRALETGRPLIFVNNGGGSAAFDRTGQALLSPLPHNQFAATWVEVPLERSREGSVIEPLNSNRETLFLRQGHNVVAGIGLTGVLAIALSAARMRLRHRKERG